MEFCLCILCMQNGPTSVQNTFHTKTLRSSSSKVYFTAKELAACPNYPHLNTHTKASRTSHLVLVPSSTSSNQSRHLVFFLIKSMGSIPPVKSHSSSAGKGKNGLWCLFWSARKTYCILSSFWLLSNYSNWTEQIHLNEIRKYTIQFKRAQTKFKVFNSPKNIYLT